MRVWVFSIVFWLLTVLLDRHVERISRRMCNLPYVTMVVTDNLQASILTGLVNLSVDTLSASSITAVFILLVYAYVLSIVIGIADYFGIKLKFW
ncbi:hypothetical protein GLYMA_01G095566v4 [Glycine max]|nr:hypothetical protein GLYMA_01G095566v4 [Glycine max]KAG4403358.1 hypothetical protein GLYMA_01G095566v4 [Glycine max]KAH1162366.1 hypothetical protein GYH30_001033 [Glycine max]KAH1162367.1 hypothetical protein GYH30_001033 [Glycine max]